MIPVVGAPADNLLAALEAEYPDDSAPPLKTCTKCRQAFSATSDNFGLDDRMADGLSSRCRKCRYGAHNTSRRARRREDKAQAHNPGHTEDQAAVARFKEVQKRPVGRPPKSDLTPEEIDGGKC
jgi:hypothetical protein